MKLWSELARCPRCSCDRLLRLAPRGPMVICLRCGFVWSEPEGPPSAGVMRPEMPATPPHSCLALARSWQNPIDAIGKGGWR